MVSVQYEYSFDDGVRGKWAGYTVLTPSKVLKIGISVLSRGGDPDDVGVSLVVNGVKTNGSILKPAGKFTNVIDTPKKRFETGRYNNVYNRYNGKTNSRGY